MKHDLPLTPHLLCLDFFFNRFPPFSPRPPSEEPRLVLRIQSAVCPFQSSFL